MSYSSPSSMIPHLPLSTISLKEPWVSDTNALSHFLAKSSVGAITDVSDAKDAKLFDDSVMQNSVTKRIKIVAGLFRVMKIIERRN